MQQVVGANQTFLASDGEDVSTTELLRRMGQAMGRPARLVPVAGQLAETGDSGGWTATVCCLAVTKEPPSSSVVHWKAVNDALAEAQRAPAAGRHL